MSFRHFVQDFSGGARSSLGKRRHDVVTSSQLSINTNDMRHGTVPKSDASHDDWHDAPGAAPARRHAGPCDPNG
eukprot:6081951-Pleurochrysis_carterae.AAC.4